MGSPSAPIVAPLTDTDVNELAALLGAEWAPAEAMDVESLDGFLAGLLCGPRRVLPSAYVPVIFGGAEPVWPSTDEATRFFELLMRRWNEIATALAADVERLDDPRAYVPLLFDWDRADEGESAEPTLDGDTGALPRCGELWGRGFARAIHVMRDDWNDVPDGDEEGAELVDECLDTILALAPVEDAPPQTPEERDALVADAIIAAYDLSAYWRDVIFERERVKEPIRRAPKVGRNDPCPCGSGKKFKHCHGPE